MNDLQLGMYVAELDRPWVETPFSFQGLRINSVNDIEQLQDNCSFVFIDRDKSSVQAMKLMSSLGQVQNSNSVANRKSVAKSATQKNTEVEQKIITPDDALFRTHMRVSLDLHHDTHNHVRGMMDAVQKGKTVDVGDAKHMVNKLADNVIQNPTALIWLTQLKNKDEYTSIHSLNVCILSLCFGRYLGFTKDKLCELGLGAMLHDIGKLRIPLEVLNKPGRLDAEEYNIVKKHPVFGYELLQGEQGLTPKILDIIKHHHERVDGQGYPSHLGGNEMGNYTQLVTVVDAYDAITSKRVYKDASTSHGAVEFLYKQSNAIFEKGMVDNFIKYLGIYPIGSTVELTTGQVGVVVSDNKNNQLLPFVLLLLNEEKKLFSKCKTINLANPQWQNSDSRPYIERIIDPGDYGLDIPMIMGRESKLLANK